jgi:hypothetical protein
MRLPTHANVFAAGVTVAPLATYEAEWKMRTGRVNWP